jgi:virginiamycin B lyase
LGAIGVAVAVGAGACSPSIGPSARPLATLDASAAPTRTEAGSPASSGSGPAATATPAALAFTVQTYEVPRGAHPHDVAPASDGGIWYTGQQNGTLGWLDPATGAVHEVPLGNGAAPHGVVSGPDGAAWVTDQGLDALVRVQPGTFEVTTYPMPEGARGYAPHTGVFDHDGVLWFTGQRGVVGRFDPATHEVEMFAAPRGAGPYGITVTPSNDIYVASLAGSYLGVVDRADFSLRVLEPPTSGAGVRRAWSDSQGRVWISEWNAGKVGRYDPADGSWREWDLPGGDPMAYSVYVDELDAVWLTDFGSNAIVRFDPVTETFQSFPSDRANAAVRQMLGRPGEAWGAESGVDRLVVVRYAPG